jgi:hypothetical protein
VGILVGEGNRSRLDHLQRTRIITRVPRPWFPSA